MRIEIIMPKMGESIQEGKILRWLKQPGDSVRKDETILEISTDKVDSEIPSPDAGVLAQIIAHENDTVPVGAAIAYLETDASAAVIPAQDEQPHAAPGRTENEPIRFSGGTVPHAALAPAGSADAQPIRGRDGNNFFSPLVREIARKEGLEHHELSAIPGTGLGGRVTKRDVLKYLKNRSATLPPPTQPAVVTRVDTSLERVDLQSLMTKYPSPAFRIAKMDTIQRVMAEHMTRSVQTSPHASAVSECDVTLLAAFRQAHGARFEERTGFRLTYTHFFVDAVVRALKEFPLLNSSIEGDAIVQKNFINLGVAVASPAGLIVPVIRQAEEKNFLGLARSLNDLSARSRTKKLLPDELQGGTFTITNFGVFGNIIGTPIINQPQVAIFGVGAIKKRPVVVSDPAGHDAIAIRSMCYCTLSFDHRIIDGETGGRFLQRVVSLLETYDLNSLT